jgi:hypothetical protein
MRQVMFCGIETDKGKGGPLAVAHAGPVGKGTWPLGVVGSSR